MTMFSPSCLSRSRWPTLKPSPMATISTIEATPQAIPAMVRKLRSLLRSRLEMTWPNNSCRYVTGDPVLLQDDLLALGQALQISVFDPLLMPVVTATRRLPVSAAASATSTSVERSFL